MDTTLILQLVKEKLGIRTIIRDTYIKAIIEGIIKELKDEQGLTLESDNSSHLLFVVDYAEWRYSSKSNGDMPRHLQFRLHNLMIHVGGTTA